MDARFSRPMEAWSRCSPAEQVTTDSCGISSQRVDKILFYSILFVRHKLLFFMLVSVSGELRIIQAATL